MISRWALVAGLGCFIFSAIMTEALAGSSGLSNTRWRSRGDEPLESGACSLVREYQFSEKDWSMTLECISGDKKIFQYAAHGTYELKGPAAEPANALELDLSFKSKSLTLLTPDSDTALAKLRMDQCGLQVGKAMSLDKQSCGPFKSMSSEPIDRTIAVMRTDQGQVYLNLGSKAHPNRAKPDSRPRQIGYTLAKVTAGGKLPPAPVFVVFQYQVKTGLAEMKSFVMEEARELAARQTGATVLVSSDNLKVESLAGSFAGPAPVNFVMVENWPSAEAFRKWWNSAEQASRRKKAGGAFEIISVSISERQI